MPRFQLTPSRAFASILLAEATPCYFLFRRRPGQSVLSSGGPASRLSNSELDRHAHSAVCWRCRRIARTSETRARIYNLYFPASRGGPPPTSPQSRPLFAAHHHAFSMESLVNYQIRVPQGGTQPADWDPQLWRTTPAGPLKAWHCSWHSWLAGTPGWAGWGSSPQPSG